MIRKRHILKIICYFAATLLCLVKVRSGNEVTQSPTRIMMPGTQFGDIAPFDSVQRCKTCHEAIYNDWWGSMHGHQGSDPMNIALRSIIVKYDILRGDWCVRCHEPTPWLEGRCQPNGEEFIRKDFFDLNCDVCHCMVDALSPDSTASIVETQLGLP